VKLSKSLLALVASAMICGMTYAEEEKKADAPKKDKPARAMKLTKPYSLIESSLTQEQKDKINAIHAEFLAEQKKLKEKEDTDIKAVLTDEQKKELDAAVEKDKASMKAPKGEKPEKPAEKKD
jgi:Spy/CpxP family protein refolding chaperone